MNIFIKISILIFSVCLYGHSQSINSEIVIEKRSDGVTLFVYHKKNKVKDTIFGTAARWPLLMDYKIINTNSVIVIYKDASGVNYHYYQKNIANLWNSSYSSGVIFPFSDPMVSFYDTILKPEPVLFYNSDIKFKILDIDKVQMTYQDKVSYVDFDKKIAARKKWLAKMAAIRKKRLEKEKEEQEKK